MRKLIALLVALAGFVAACGAEPPRMRELKGAELELARAQAQTRLALRLAGEGEFPKPRTTKPDINEHASGWYCVYWTAVLGLPGYLACAEPTSPNLYPGYDGFSVRCVSDDDLNQPGLNVMTGPQGNGWCTRFEWWNWSWYGEHWYSNPNIGAGDLHWNDKIQSWQANDVLEVYFWEHINYGGNAFSWTFNDNDWYMRWNNMPATTSSIDIRYGW